MRLVVDAVGVGPGSAAIVIGNLIAAWATAVPGDEIVVLSDGQPAFVVPESVRVQRLLRRPAALGGRLWAQTVGVRWACRRLRADALLSAITASALLGSPCPHGVIVYDLRHEQRPEQFSLRRRLLRRLVYGWAFRRADALLCISARTRDDLLGSRPQLRSRAHVALLGADHTRGWRPAGEPGAPYALAFAHFTNKNLGLVLDAWRLFTATHRHIDLRVCGLEGDARTAAQRLVGELGLDDRVVLLPWLDDAAFQATFAGAAVVLLPSDFEGFGLPAIEALHLGVPVVVSDDPALLEVTGGHAVLAAAGGGAAGLAAAIEEALRLPADAIAAGAAYARGFTWRRCALTVRGVLAAQSGESAA